LQSAGELVSRTGSTLSYGDGDDARQPQYSFPRTIDYGAAACLLVRRAAFQRVGGFDTVFTPGYYEDADLCFAIASHGWEVRYEPRARVLHARGGSGGSTNPLLVAHNQAVFQQRWANELALRPPAPLAGHPARLADARDARTIASLLVITETPPLESSPARRLLDLLRRNWPSARLTLATHGALPDELSGWMLRAGVEPVDDEDQEMWKARRGRYDAIFTDRQPLPAACEAAMASGSSILPIGLDSTAVAAGLAAAGLPPAVPDLTGGQWRS
jgi:hypothetical protein